MTKSKSAAKGSGSARKSAKSRSSAKAKTGLRVEQPTASLAEDVRREAKDNQLYTTKEAAALLKLHVGTLANWRSGGGSVELPFVKVGRSVKYRHSDLMKFVNSHSYETTTAAAHDERIQ